MKKRRNKKMKRYRTVSLLTMISVIIGVFFISTTILSNLKTKNNDKKNLKKLQAIKKKKQIQKNKLKSYEYPAYEVVKIISNKNLSNSTNKQTIK